MVANFFGVAGGGGGGMMINGEGPVEACVAAGCKEKEFGGGGCRLNDAGDWLLYGLRGVVILEIANLNVSFLILSKIG